MPSSSSSASARARDVLVQTADLGGQHHVIENAAPIQEQVPLEDDAGIGDRLGDGQPINEHAPRTRDFEASDELQQRTLAAATGAHDAERLALAQLHGDRQQCLDFIGALTVAVRHPKQLNAVRRCRGRPLRIAATRGGLHHDSLG